MTLPDLLVDVGGVCPRCPGSLAIEVVRDEAGCRTRVVIRCAESGESGTAYLEDEILAGAAAGYLHDALWIATAREARGRLHPAALPPAFETVDVLPAFEPTDVPVRGRFGRVRWRSAS